MTRMSYWILLMVVNSMTGISLAKDGSAFAVLPFAMVVACAVLARFSYEKERDKWPRA